MRTFGATLIAIFLGASLAECDEEIHVVTREFLLKENGTKEPVWEAHREEKKVSEPGKRDTESGNVIFPNLSGAFEFDRKFDWSATKSGRGRIVISLNEDGKLIAHTQDNSFGNACALVHTINAGHNTFKLVIKVWTTGNEEKRKENQPAQGPQ